MFGLRRASGLVAVVIATLPALAMPASAKPAPKVLQGSLSTDGLALVSGSLPKGATFTPVSYALSQRNATFDGSDIAILT
jgi:hypothetical protein